MKRYKMRVDCPGLEDFIFVRQYESPDGEWVKYEDVELLTVIKECNCIEKHEELWRYWICPAHGYKKR